MRALCATRPAEWWETGDDGNRLAVLLCGVCPRIKRCPKDVPEPAGVVVAGVAYTDAGVALPTCVCGYPCVGYRGGPVRACKWCTGVDVRRLERVKPSGEFDEAVVQRLVAGKQVHRPRRVDRREAFRRLFASGLTAREVGERMGIGFRSAQVARRRLRMKVAA